jgi:hypothetical protein
MQPQASRAGTAIPVMSERLNLELGKMLDGYDERRRVDLVRTRKAQDDDAAFIASFTELRRSVVRPVFDAAGALLAERGHSVRILEMEFAADPNGKTTEAGISIQVAPAGTQPEGERRSLTISTRHYNKTVWVRDDGAAFYSSGMAVAKGSYPLERIDARLVEEELIKFVGGVVAG